jgi:hypothetical protein
MIISTSITNIIRVSMLTLIISFIGVVIEARHYPPPIPPFGAFCPTGQWRCECHDGSTQCVSSDNDCISFCCRFNYGNPPVGGSC